MVDKDSALEVKDGTYWEKVAETQWGSYISEIERQMILKADKLVGEGLPHTALDIGCEGGRWSKLLTDLGWSVICTDISVPSLALCHERIPTATCILVKQTDQIFPCPSSYVSLLLCIEVFPVIKSDYFIDEAFRVLCSGGFIVSVIQNKLSFRAYFHNLVRYWNDKDDFYGTSYPKWRNKLRDHGFKLLAETGLCWSPFPRDSDSFLIPIFTYLELVLGLRKLPGVSPWVAFIAQKI